MDAERAGKVINPGVLIGEGVISGEGSAGGCCGRGESSPCPPSRLGHFCQSPGENWQLKTGVRGKSNKTGPGLEPEQHREAQGWVGLAGGHPGVPSPPQPLLPLLGEAAPATLQAPALLNLPA